MDVDKTKEFILEKHAYAASLLAECREIGERTDRRLDRAVKLAVREARAERKRRKEVDGV